MINAIEVKNFKSAEKLALKFGRVNTFIGENGSGKSTILEALAFAVAANNNKLEAEYLENRGIRVTAPELMRSQFESTDVNQNIEIRLFIDEGNRARGYILDNENSTYSEWKVSNYDLSLSDSYQVDEVKTKGIIWSLDSIRSELSKIKTQEDSSDFDRGDNELTNNEEFTKALRVLRFFGGGGSGLLPLLSDSTFKYIENFAIYTPENTQLRNLKQEGSFRPVGVQGQGLFRLLRQIAKEQPGALPDIEEGLKLIGWYESMDLENEPELIEDELFIKDRFLSQPFTQRSANEGFLYVLFYLSLIVSEAAPKIFAIDNLDSALNPKLCKKLMTYIYELACKYDKQIFLTTHNPALLDGINLNDEQQKLFVVSRAKKGGQTKVKALSAEKKPVDSEGNPLPLSEAMLRGYIGGLPKGF